MNYSDMTPEEKTKFDQWLADQAQERHALFTERLPHAFRKTGTLPAEIAQWRDAYRAGATGSLVLYGPTGAGKTWAVWHMIGSLIRDGWRGGYAISPAYEVREATMPSTADPARVAGWKRADLWCLDDLGASSVTEWGSDALLAIIDHRWQHGRPTIITTNSLKLRSMLGERSASRIADGCTTVEIAADDRRRKGGN